MNFCHNCKRYANHTALYCDNEPQKILRCDYCWNSCSQLIHHGLACRNDFGIDQLLLGVQLDKNDYRHQICDRLNIETSGIVLINSHNL